MKKNFSIGFQMLKIQYFQMALHMFPQTPVCDTFELQNTTGGVEDTRLEAKAKDPKKTPRPRPRTAFPRTDPLEAKDRNARGQGQGPRTQPQGFFKKKKHLQKSFSGNLQFIGVARIFDWGGLNHKSHAMTSSKICLFFT